MLAQFSALRPSSERRKAESLANIWRVFVINISEIILERERKRYSLKIPSIEHLDTSNRKRRNLCKTENGSSKNAQDDTSIVNKTVFQKVHKRKEIQCAITNSMSYYINVDQRQDLNSRPIVARAQCPTHRLSSYTDIDIM